MPARASLCCILVRLSSTNANSQGNLSRRRAAMFFLKDVLIFVGDPFGSSVNERIHKAIHSCFNDILTQCERNVHISIHIDTRAQDFAYQL